MSFAETKLRIASRRQIDKADVESVYSELVRVVGGTTYSAGVATGPTNGLLDGRNFSANAGILNSQKSAPYAEGTISFSIKETLGVGTWEDRQPTPPILDVLVPRFSIVLTGWTLTCQAVSTTTNSATATLSTNLGILATQALTNFTAQSVLTNQALLTNFTMTKPGNIFLSFQQNTAGLVTTYLISTVWFKAFHVR